MSVKLFTAEQIKNWDSFTINNEPVTSIDLMERAANACANWILQNFNNAPAFKIFCGKGNNGGDGLAIARLLIGHNFPVSVYIVESNSAGSDDFNTNLQRLKEKYSAIYFLASDEEFPEIKKDDIVIDALFGTGLNKKPSGIFKKLILHLNNSGAQIISIDISSGLYADVCSIGNAVIRPRYTLTFQQTKLAFLLPENESFYGEVVILDIGLSRQFCDEEYSVFIKIRLNKFMFPGNLLLTKETTAMRAW